jgi:hypothetical protein
MSLTYSFKFSSPIILLTSNLIIPKYKGLLSLRHNIHLFCMLINSRHVYRLSSTSQCTVWIENTLASKIPNSALITLYDLCEQKSTAHTYILPACAILLQLSAHCKGCLHLPLFPV